MHDTLTKCATPDCPNMSYHTLCLTCSAQEATRKLQHASEGVCTHGHSITGDYDMIKRLLPDYKGSEPQPGYMLDVCKICLQELPERPYNPTRAIRGHHSAPIVDASAGLIAHHSAE